MIKYPEPGKVKTRLAHEIGKVRASAVCKHIAEQVLRNTAPSEDDRYSRIVFIDPPEREDDFQGWLPGEQFAGQQGSDLGERMDNAIRHLLSRGTEKAVITGADIPDLSCDIIMQAFKKLDHVDVVIGPAADGGYYLIGMKSPMTELFRNVSWSTGNVFSETVKTLQRSGKSYGVLPILSDLDTIADLNRVLK
ncbi:MAG: TIGR04282 family arsenosugar biosynthesis glycosyltransferase [Nitrospirae bacterium]|nr:TIGR04282 family arsenosugar biosynthesis glycosyltransferase [Nitrospirota bacterium]